MSLLPQTVNNTYKRILTKSSNPKEAKKLLYIIIAAARPLTLAEMDLALALRQNHRSYKDYRQTAPLLAETSNRVISR
jgi:hypothetical protein